MQSLCQGAFLHGEGRQSHRFLAGIMVPKQLGVDLMQDLPDLGGHDTGRQGTTAGKGHEILVRAGSDGPFQFRESGQFIPIVCTLSPLECRHTDGVVLGKGVGKGCWHNGIRMFG